TKPRAIGMYVMSSVQTWFARSMLRLRNRYGYTGLAGCARGVRPPIQRRDPHLAHQSADTLAADRKSPPPAAGLAASGRRRTDTQDAARRCAASASGPHRSPAAAGSTRCLD